MSGGYIGVELAKLSAKIGNPTQLQLIEGTPRELMADFKAKSGGRPGAESAALVSLAFIKYKSFSRVASLIPSNCLVSLTDMVPGLAGNNRKLTLPKPIFSKAPDKKADSTNMKADAN